MFSDVPGVFLVCSWCVRGRSEMVPDLTAGVVLGSLVNVTCLFYTDTHVSYCLMVCKLQ